MVFGSKLWKDLCLGILLLESGLNLHVHLEQEFGSSSNYDEQNLQLFMK